MFGFYTTFEDDLAHLAERLCMNTEHLFEPSSRIDKNDDHFLISVDLPGAEKETVDVTVEEGLLQISATNYRRGDKKLSLKLPAYAESEDISASLKRGVLEVTIPFKKKDSRSIPIS